MTDVVLAAESVFREESGRILAALIRISGSFDLAEESMQEGFGSALQTWPQTGIPNNAGAWITAVARRKLVDRVRKAQVRFESQNRLLYEEMIRRLGAEDEADTSEMQYPDDRLRLIFTCCHPALNIEARIALTLRTLE